MNSNRAVNGNVFWKCVGNVLWEMLLVHDGKSVLEMIYGKCFWYVMGNVFCKSYGNNLFRKMLFESVDFGLNIFLK
jgi:hypothetical protein